ncbi:MAG TPA: NAD(P)-dependent oxidoreductase [Kofleriaceae bacterium]|nr:NAD(P)-dependent oxidoreductase [Kofleriaceae bacterium]
MILVTGGLGFLGCHVARALVDAGARCVVTRHHASEVPAFLRGDVEVIACDVTERASVVAIGDRYPITGVIHLAAGWPSNPFDEVRDSGLALANVGAAAAEWRVKRLCVASTIGVYGGVVAPQVEEGVALAHTGNRHPIPALKKAAEIFAEQVDARGGLECVVLRIAGLYGPRYRGLRTFVSRAVHAAAHGTSLDVTGVAFGSGPDDSADWCYVKDCARGIALLQLAPALRHRTYNVGAGVSTRNRDVIAALRRIVPGARLDEPAGTPAPAILAFDLGRIRADTGYEPRYTLDTGLGEYVDWLRAGNAY